MLAGTAALTLAGCAIVGPPGKGHPARTAPAAPASPPGLSPEQRAQADAAAILGEFAVPAGAKQLPVPPASVSSALKAPVQLAGTQNLVDRHSLWVVSGAPAAVLAWEERHLPRQFTRLETFRGNLGPARGMAGSGDVFSLPAVADVLDTRELLVEVMNAGGGQTAIRVDAQVAWVAPKPAGAVVPPAATVVTLSLNYGGNAGGRQPPAPVTITGPATAGQVAALIDHVPPSPGGTYNCPADDGAALGLAFRARPGGPALATAVLQLSGCEWVDLTVGRQDYGLGHPDGARSTAAQVLKAADVPWTLPSFLWPRQRDMSRSTQACPGDLVR